MQLLDEMRVDQLDQWLPKRHHPMHMQHLPTPPQLLELSKGGPQTIDHNNLFLIFQTVT